MQELKERMKKLTDQYASKYQTRDPFEIAEKLGIIVQIGNLGSRYGCYMYLKKHKCIFLNENLDRHTMKFVMAHELGHAIMHPRRSCCFVRNKEVMNRDLEKEANMFAVWLIMGNRNLEKYVNYTMEELKNAFGYSEIICKLRWEIF